MNAKSTFAASVCDSDVSPAAFRTIALRRGSTTRTSPSAEADPVADRDLDALVHEAPRQAGTDDLLGRLDVERSTVRRDHAPRHETGLQVGGELRCPPEHAEIELGQSNPPFGT